jgi:hypothetical protein
VLALQEEAVEFARKYGWEATVEDPQARNPIRQKRFAGYGDNFRSGQNLVSASCAAVAGYNRIPY